MVFGIFKSKKSRELDEDLSRQFLQKAHSDSEQNAFLIQVQINLVTGEKMKVTEYKSAEVAAAVIGTSLGLLSTGGSALMSSSQGKKVLQLCKKYNLKDTKASLGDAKAFQKGIDEYITGFKKSLAMKTNPFNQPAGILLMNFGIMEKANVGLIYKNPPEGFLNRSVVPVNLKKKIFYEGCLIKHLSNKYVKEKKTNFSTIKINNILI